MPVIPTIVFADNENGTGTVSISGSDPGATNSLWTMRLDHNWPVNSWTKSAEQAGNGSLTVSFIPGVFWISVSSELEGSTVWTPPSYQKVSLGRPPVIDQIVEAVAARIRLLQLPGVDAAHVLTGMSLDVNMIGQCRQNTVLVAPSEEGEDYLTGGPTTRDWWGHNIKIALVAPANQDQSQKTRWYKWRELVRRGFVNQPLQLGVPEVQNAEFVKMSSFLRNYWEANLFASLMGFRFRSAEFRGMGV
ncbi:hypothetical protein SH668x_001265 [Planctomicrobium sp. SH668]|uniref:hypothetical protein n=1 Tax=Planctomicrobium sp. SH668 TaxID=3448126 RepID=UPI003F5B4B33